MEHIVVGPRPVHALLRRCDVRMSCPTLDLHDWRFTHRKLSAERVTQRVPAEPLCPASLMVPQPFRLVGAQSPFQAPQAVGALMIVLALTLA